MNKKLLCCALLGALGFAQAAAAQEYDDRWYVSGDLGVVLFDGERGLQDSAIYKVGFGKFFAPNWSWEVGLNSTNPNKNLEDDLLWSQYGIDLTGRYHFIREERNWWPYIAFGVGALRHEDEYPNLNGGRPIDREGTELEVHGGFGLQADYGRTDLRAEVGFRTDFDDRSGLEDNDSFTDFIASVGVVVALGPEPDRAVVVEETQTEETVTQSTCADMDDDGDGVNNCDDKCPNSTAGQTIGPDGCPVPVTIDLRGVNFDFDKSTLRPDAIATLDEAISVLKQYPDLRVEVAGHTDECGSDEYNQSLSDRRSRAVYDYLTANGIDAGRLAGPNGYGESRPLESLGDAFPGCKSETNRRTELNVQN
jgi:OOP family OmpA-OmpF porin